MESKASPHTTAHVLHSVAAVTPTLMRVSIVDVPCIAFLKAALWNGHAPHVTTGIDRAIAHHCQPSNIKAVTIEINTTGMVNAADTTNRKRAVRKRSSKSSSNG